MDAPDHTQPLVVLTSGSTGDAKRVELSASALRASAAATLDRLGGPGQWVLALGAYHVAGVQVIVRSVLASTSPVLLDDHPDLAAATTALTGQRRYLAIVPTQLHRWLRVDSAVAALCDYDAVLVGGAAARPNLLDEARGRGVNVITTYGMSETCGGCVYDGVALDGVALALGTAGQIRVAGPVLFDGYVDQPALTGDVLRDGWLHTPDLGRFDEDGRLVVLGRADDVIVSGGIKVALPAVEQRLAAMPGVAEVAVVGAPDEEWGMRVVAVVATGSPAYDLDAVRDFVSDTLPREWAPTRVVALDRLPLLSSGKVDRQALLTRLGFGRPGPAQTPSTQSDEAGMG